MSKNKSTDNLKRLVGINSNNNIEQAIALLQKAQSYVDAYAVERATRQLHVGTLSQLKKQLGDITKKLSGYVEG